MVSLPQELYFSFVNLSEANIISHEEIFHEQMHRKYLKWTVHLLASIFDIIKYITYMIYLKYLMWAMTIVTLTKVILRLQRMCYSPGPFNLHIYFKVKKNRNIVL